MNRLQSRKLFGSSALILGIGVIYCGLSTVLGGMYVSYIGMLPGVLLAVSGILHCVAGSRLYGDVSSDNHKTKWANVLAISPIVTLAACLAVSYLVTSQDDRLSTAIGVVGIIALVQLIFSWLFLSLEKKKSRGR